MQKYRLLVVDDESDICAILKYNLEKAGYEVDTASSAEEAMLKELSSYSLILLDIMMGEMSGIDMAKRMKEQPSTAKIPIVFITAKDSEDDTVEGLNLGADDYISKPFSVREVVSRIGAVLRRCAPAVPGDRLCYQNMLLDLSGKSLMINGKDVQLTKTEFEILHLLLSSPERVFSRQEILEKVWPNEVYVLDRTVDVNITRLRRKMGEYGENIVTRHGYGYCFQKNGR